MRSIKRLLLLAFAGAVAAALTVPALASAGSWADYGAKLSSGTYEDHMVWSKSWIPVASGEPKLSLEGEVGFSSATAGSIQCPTSLSTTLEPNGGNGHITSFSVTTAGCVISGFFKSAGCTTIKSAEPVSLPWKTEAAGTDAKRKISIQGFQVIYTLSGGGCGTGMPVTYTGLSDLAASPTGDPEQLSTLAMGGEAQLSGGFGKGKATGSLTVKSAEPAGTYGISDRATGTPSVAVSGTLGWTSATWGSMQCPVTGNLVLKPGESGEGVVTRFDMDASKCTLGGYVKTSCGSMKSIAAKNLPWPVFAEGSTIRITEVPVRMLFGASGECADWSTTGEMTATPNSQEAISTTSLAGELKTGGFTTFKYTGSLSWSPAARYGFYP